MYTVKTDKRGKVLIPYGLRKSLKLFVGQRMDIGYTKDHLGKDIIVIKPFEYICRWCGEEIPEGDLHGSCKACSIKNTKNVY